MEPPGWNDLPDERGVYLLVLRVDETFTAEIGQAGKRQFPPAFYFYLDTAQNSDGLRSRIGSHLERETPQGWHVDRLLEGARVLEVWHAAGDRRLEKRWSEMLRKSTRFRVVAPHFATSEFHRSRVTHLFRRKRPFRFERFRQWMRQGPGVEVERAVIDERPEE